MHESRPIKVSFSFYSADVTALAARVSELKKAGVMVRSATVLRALVYLTTGVKCLPMRSGWPEPRPWRGTARQRLGYRPPDR